MKERSDADYLGDHLDNMLGSSPYSPPAKQARWAGWIKKRGGGCVGYSIQSLPRLRWYPSGENQGMLLRLTLFGETCEGTDTELLKWAEWKAEQYADQPNQAAIKRERERYEHWKLIADQVEEVKKS